MMQRATPTAGNNHRRVGVVAMGTGTPTTRSPDRGGPTEFGRQVQRTPPTPQLDKLSAWDVSSAGYRLQARTCRKSPIWPM